MLNFALKYLRMGLSIIPLQPKGKEPLIPWKEFQTRRASESEVREWFTKEPGANIGIVTGTISGVVVIDLDGPEGLSQASLLKLSSSLVSSTGDGKHLWYSLPLMPAGVDMQNAVRIKPGIDLRGTGGYVVVPPSVHPSGRRYRWLNGALGMSKLSEFPKEFMTSTTAPISAISKLIKPENWISKALEEMKDGNIDSTLFTICSRFRADGYSADDARILLSPYAEKAGATPGHLDEKIENVWSRYEPNVRKGAGIAVHGAESASTGLIIHSPTKPESWEQFQNSSRNDTEIREKLATGYSKLDLMLKGGIKSSRLFTIAARTGVGKTNFLIAIARSLCQQGFRVLLFSTEMAYTDIWARYIAALGGTDEFKKHAFYVCDSFAPNLEKVEEAINEIKPTVFMFDHINHVSEDQKELGAFMQGLNFIRRKYDVAGIVTAQLNRQADWVDIKTGEKVTPRMSMIKGSGTIEQASSRVLLLSETRVSNDMTEIVGNLDKNDNGPKGLIHFGLKTNPYRMIEL